MEWYTLWLSGLAVLLVANTLLWLWSVKLRNASIVDIWWGLGFVIVGWVYAHLQAAPTLRNLVVLAALMVWGVRLSVHLLLRNAGKGEDYRYQEFRRQYGPERYWWISFFQVFVLQGMLAWLISFPLAAVTLTATPWNAVDTLALIVWFTGFTFEAVGDAQLVRFKREPQNKGKLLTTGLWRYTRHPNYFGDALVWWAFGLWATAAGSWPALLASGLMTFLLLRVSGVAMLERSLVKSKPGYEDYIRNTNAFFPGLPRHS